MSSNESGLEGLRAFISSNIEEFKGVRGEIATLLEKYNIDPIYWESPKLKKPSDMSREEFYRHFLNLCQLYIGLLGEIDSRPTEDEYEEASLSSLERWLFIKDGAHQGQQMVKFRDRIEKEVVRERFADGGELIKKLEGRIKTFLPETARVHIEMRKGRAYEFLVDYRKGFLEPLLIQVELDKKQLQERKSLPYWEFQKFKDHPYFRLDGELIPILDTWFALVKERSQLQGIAYGVYRSNAAKTVELRITQPLVSKFQSNKPQIAIASVHLLNKLCQFESPLLYIRPSNKFKDEVKEMQDTREKLKASIRKRVEELENEIEQPVRETLAIPPGSNYSNDYAEDAVWFLLFLNSGQQDVEVCLTCRDKLAQAVAQANTELWNRFLKSTGVLF